MKRMRGAALFLLVVLATARGQEAEAPQPEPTKPEPTKPEPIDAWAWVTLKNLLPLRDEVMRSIEELTRIRFRQPVEVRILSRMEWEQRVESEGFMGATADRTSAYYSPGVNVITFQPWIFSWKATAEDWRTRSRQTMIHELTHALHHQNFYTEGGDYRASLRTAGLTEDQIDNSTVDFLVAEGFAELVSYSLSLRRVKRATRARAPTRADVDFRLGRKPERRPQPLADYMKRYRPTGEDAYRLLLFDHGYQDGLTCLYHLMLSGGMRSVRSVLYRIPHRMLLFSPDLLAGTDLDDPPEPDPIFEFLHPGPLDPEGILLATNPGPGRFFRSAIHGKARGCLLGYTARATQGEYAGSEYAFFVADPDAPGDWADQQLDSLRKLATGRGRIRERKHVLPLSRRTRVTITTVPVGEGLYVHARHEGIVVLVRERKRTRSVEQRVLAALRALIIKRPTPGVFREARAKAEARLNG